MQLVWLAENDPLKIAAYEQLPLIDYYILLDKKTADIEKAIADAKGADKKSAKKNPKPKTK